MLIMVAVLLHLVSPINTRKRKSFCNTIIINILQPIEKVTSSGKFNKKNTQKDKSFCCRYLNINKNSFFGFFNYQPSRLSSSKPQHIIIYPQTYILMFLLRHADHNESNIFGLFIMFSQLKNIKLLRPIRLNPSFL